MEVIRARYEGSALKALSETCTVLRDISQPLLYHVPGIKTYGPFLRTIWEHPHLAKHVKYILRLNVHWRGPDKGLAVGDGFALVKKIATQLQMLTPLDNPLEDEFSSLRASFTPDIDDCYGPSYLTLLQEGEFAILLHTILIALLPCLEVLYIHGWLVDGFCPPQVYHHAKRRLERAGRLVSDRCSGTSMPSLHTIVIEGVGNLDDIDDDYDDRHVHLDPREVLFSCASSLKQIIFRDSDAPFHWRVGSRATNSTIWSTLPALSTVEFDSVRWGLAEVSGDFMVTPVPAEKHDIAYERIRQMVTQCAAVSSFKVTASHYDNPYFDIAFSPSRLLQSLIPISSRLETLAIHIKDIKLQNEPAVLLGADMHGFTKLRHLYLDEMCFCHHRIYGRQPEDEVDEEDRTIPGEAYPEVCRTNSCLVDILPKSVTSLHLQLPSKPWSVPDLMQLGKEAVAGKFPNLRRLSIDASVHEMHQEPPNSFLWPERLRADEQIPLTGRHVQVWAPKLAEVFRGSGVALEVIATWENQSRRNMAVPML